MKVFQSLKDTLKEMMLVLLTQQIMQLEFQNHFFVSGEKLKYVHVGETDSATSVLQQLVLLVLQTFLLENLFAVKVDDNVIKIATSAANALKSIPEVVVVELESVGIGTSHRFVSTNQNAKVVVALDNVIQSPVVSTAQTTTLG